MEEDLPPVAADLLPLEEYLLLVEADLLRAVLSLPLLAVALSGPTCETEGLDFHSSCGLDDTDVDIGEHHSTQDDSLPQAAEGTELQEQVNLTDDLGPSRSVENSPARSTPSASPPNLGSSEASDQVESVPDTGYQ